MSFLNPIYLWGLLLALPIIAVYLLKVKPRTQQTNAWFLWQEVLEKKQSNSLFSKLRSFLSLLLLLLILLLICIGLSNPIFSKSDTRDIIILVDRSASMQGKFTNTSALELAKKEARSYVNALAVGQRASVASVDHSIQFLSHLSSNHQDLHNLINDLEPSNLAENNLSEQTILHMVESQFSEEAEEPSVRVVFITDGCNGFTFDEDLPLETVIVGKETRENVGIIAADMQPVLASSDASLMVQLVNSGTSEEVIELEIFNESTQSIAELIELTLKPGENPPAFFNIKNANSGSWKVRFSREDAVQSDNEVLLIMRPRPIVTVSVPNDNNYFYQRCIESFSKTSGALVLASENAQLQLLEGETSTSSTSNCMIFNPTGDSQYWEVKGKVENIVVPVIKEETHPILAHINLDSLEFYGVKNIIAPENAQVIVETETGIPLIYQVNESQRSVIIVNINPQLNDFYLHTSFVVLIYDAAMLVSGNQRSLPSVFSVGSSYENNQNVPVSLIYPNDQQVEIEPSRSVYLDQLGGYSVIERTGAKALSVGLLSSRESGLLASLDVRKGDSVSAGYPISFWLIILAIILLILESILYHRRKVD